MKLTTRTVGLDLPTSALEDLESYVRQVLGRLQRKVKDAQLTLAPGGADAPDRMICDLMMSLGGPAPVHVRYQARCHNVATAGAAKRARHALLRKRRAGQALTTRLQPPAL